jgi:ribosomal protein S18 acetylase RimI-like enzyme
VGDRIAQLYLLKAYHGRGIGRALLLRLLAALRARGVEEAAFEVLAVNLAARAFYEAHGARCIGVRTQRHAAGSYEDAVYVIATGVPAP